MGSVCGLSSIGSIAIFYIAYDVEPFLCLSPFSQLWRSSLYIFRWILRIDSVFRLFVCLLILLCPYESRRVSVAFS